MACPPDARIAEIAALIGRALRHIDTAVARLGSDADEATDDAAIVEERRLEHVYFEGMAALLEVEDRNERIARRELYRSCSRLGELLQARRDRGRHRRTRRLGRNEGELSAIM